MYYDEQGNQEYSSPDEKRYFELMEDNDSGFLFYHGLFLIPIPSGIGLLLRALFYAPEKYCWITLSVFLVIMILLDIFCICRHHYKLFFTILTISGWIAAADIVLLVAMNR